MIYLDTSALVKRFVDEIGSPLVVTLTAERGPGATSKVIYAELFAALARRKRERHLSPRQPNPGSGPRQGQMPKLDGRPAVMSEDGAGSSCSTVVIYEAWRSPIPG